MNKKINKIWHEWSYWKLKKKKKGLEIRRKRAGLSWMISNNRNCRLMTYNYVKRNEASLRFMQERGLIKTQLNWNRQAQQSAKSC